MDRILEIDRCLSVMWHEFSAVARAKVNDKEIERFIEAKDSLHTILSKFAGGVTLPLDGKYEAVRCGKCDTQLAWYCDHCKEILAR